jgi:hypothetical protein
LAGESLSAEDLHLLNLEVFGLVHSFTLVCSTILLPFTVFSLLISSLAAFNYCYRCVSLPLLMPGHAFGTCVTYNPMACSYQASWCLHCLYRSNSHSCRSLQL